MLMTLAMMVMMICSVTFISLWDVYKSRVQIVLTLGRTEPCSLAAAQLYNPPRFVLLIPLERVEVELQGFSVSDLFLDELVPGLNIQGQYSAGFLFLFFWSCDQLKWEFCLSKSKDMHCLVYCCYSEWFLCKKESYNIWFIIEKRAKGKMV